MSGSPRGSSRRRLLPAIVLLLALASALALGMSVGSSHPTHPRRAEEAPIALAHVATRRVGPRERSLRRVVAGGQGLDRALGQTIVSPMKGTVPSPALLARIRAGHLGGVILFAENFEAGTGSAARAIHQLQKAAREAGTWPLLIMTDQEGGEVRRLRDAPPRLAPLEMTSAAIAFQEGLAAGRALAAVGVNVDLAPVADVEQVAGSFLGKRSFGASPRSVAARACAFAHGLVNAGVDYTLKHFPGLGTARASTDGGAVVIETPASELRDSYAAYRRCGSDQHALVMIASASYPTLSGNAAPAVDAPETYRVELALASVHAVTISDDLEAGALVHSDRPAARALSAGLDLLLYAQSEQVAGESYEKLDEELRAGGLSASRVRRAAAEVMRLKSGIGGGG